jgi:hypothetical protein
MSRTDEDRGAEFQFAAFPLSEFAVLHAAGLGYSR